MVEIVEDVVPGSEEYDDNSEDSSNEYDASLYASKYVTSRDDVTWRGYKAACRYKSAEAAQKGNRLHRRCLANRFWRGCTFNDVLNTCIQLSGDNYTWLDNSFGLTWVAVHGMDGSISVVTRLSDLDMTRVSPFYQRKPKHEVVYALIEAITYKVEGFAYDDDDDDDDDDIPGKSAKSIIRPPFVVVSVFPVPKKSDEEESGQLASSVEYDREKAICFLMEKLKSEPVNTVDDAIKTAISGFKHLCLQELEAEEYWVSKWDRKGLLYHLMVPEIEKHLAVNYGCSGSGNGSQEDDGSGSRKQKQEDWVPEAEAGK